VGLTGAAEVSLIVVEAEAPFVGMLGALIVNILL
jgi:hypothetical protein